MLLGHARGRFNSKDSWIRVLKFAKAWHQSSRVKSLLVRIVLGSTLMLVLMSGLFYIVSPCHNLTPFID
jgi:hypothetical protein